MEQTEQKIFRKDAEAIVDALFENKVLQPHFTRSEMTSIADYIEFCMTSRYNMEKKISAFLERVELRVSNKKEKSEVNG